MLQWLAKIEKAASDGAWQAAAWKLERRYPHVYGRVVNEHVGRDNGPIRHEVVLSHEQQAIAERIAATRGLAVEDVVAEAKAILAGEA